MDEHFFSPEILLSEEGCYRPLCPVEDEYVAGEIVNRWHHREQSRRLKDIHERDMLEFDATLAELLFRRKQMLCRLGRSGQWSLWLRQQKISRSTADRLVAQYAESHGFADELRHRNVAEPLEGSVCLAANRVVKRLKNMLSTPRSRMTFLTALANSFGLQVEYGVNCSMHLSLPLPPDEKALSKPVPNILQVLDDGRVVPMDYEVKEANPEGDGEVLRPCGSVPI